MAFWSRSRSVAATTTTNTQMSTTTSSSGSSTTTSDIQTTTTSSLVMTETSSLCCFSWWRFRSTERRPTPLLEDMDALLVAQKGRHDAQHHSALSSWRRLLKRGR